MNKLTTVLLTLILSSGVAFAQDPCAQHEQALKAAEAKEADAQRRRDDAWAARAEADRRLHDAQTQVVEAEAEMKAAYDALPARYKTAQRGDAVVSPRGEPVVAVPRDHVRGSQNRRMLRRTTRALARLRRAQKKADRLAKKAQKADRKLQDALKELEAAREARQQAERDLAECLRQRHRAELEDALDQALALPDPALQRAIDTVEQAKRDLEEAAEQAKAPVDEETQAALEEQVHEADLVLRVALDELVEETKKNEGEPGEAEAEESIAGANQLIDGVADDFADEPVEDPTAQPESSQPQPEPKPACA